MKLPFLLLMAVAFALTSCLEMKSVVIVSKDGTATIEETVVLGPQLTAMMQGGQAGQLKELIMDKTQAAERAKTLGEGVTVKSYEELKPADGKSGVKIVYAVADLSKLKYEPYIPEQEDDKSDTGPDAMTFALQGSTLTITSLEAKDKKSGEAKGQESPDEIAMMKSQVAMMKPMLAGMRMSVEVKAANGFASSDAAHLSNDTISFLELQFDKFTNNMDVLSSLIDAAQDDMSMADAAVKFKNVDGIKIEGKHVVKAELK
ncbi:hypothetical protein [Prosthecobacter sp.]|uniref:hypothetical protein n=1 Tax=Prosthecobacter sp. TaxID=1965333 RepID=UPI003784D50A